MISRDDLLGFLDEYLGAKAFKDYCVNGLQVEGSDTITKTVTAVSCSLELFELAAARGAEMIIVHHGLFWKPGAMSLTGVLGRRVRALIEADINLVAYHGPLDMHPVIGNNASLLRSLGASELELYPPDVRNDFALFHGVFDPPLPREVFEERLATVADDFLKQGGGDGPIHRVAVITGKSPNSFYDAIELGCDAFVTGEPAEFAMHLARETGVSFYACGHYDTERDGVINLGELLKARFPGLEVEFVELPNPV